MELRNLDVPFLDKNGRGALQCKDTFIITRFFAYVKADTLSTVRTGLSSVETIASNTVFMAGADIFSSSLNSA
jgi:hypothetical protein